MSGLPVAGDYDSFAREDVIDRAADGDRDALHQVWRAARSFVTRMCRAELGAVLGVPGADAAAESLVPVVVAAVLADRTGAPLRVAYTEAVLGVEAVLASRALQTRHAVADPSGRLGGRGRLGGLGRHERDVLVLRTVVGLTVEQTAEALASTTARILLDQHAALGLLRRLTAPGAPIHS